MEALKNLYTGLIYHVLFFFLQPNLFLSVFGMAVAV